MHLFEALCKNTLEAGILCGRLPLSSTIEADEGLTHRVSLYPGEQA